MRRVRSRIRSIIKGGMILEGSLMSLMLRWALSIGLCKKERDLRGLLILLKKNWNSKMRKNISLNLKLNWKI